MVGRHADGRDQLPDTPPTEGMEGQVLLPTGYLDSYGAGRHDGLQTTVGDASRIARDSGVDHARNMPADPVLGRLFKRVFGMAAALAFSQILVGVAYVIAARSLGPSRFGSYTTAIALSMAAVALFDFGLSGFIVRELASERLTVGAVAVALRHKRHLAWSVVVPVSAAAFVILHNAAAAVSIGLAFVATWEAQTLNGLLRSRHRFVAGSVGQIAGRTVVLGVVAGFAATGGNEALLAVGLLSGWAIEAATDRVLLGGITPTRPAASLMRLQRRAVSYGLTSLAASAQQLDTPLVAIGGGVVSAGLYAAAARLLGPLGVLSQSLSGVAGPWLARSQDSEALLRQEERRVWIVTWVVALVPLLATVAGPVLLPRILGRSYAASGRVVGILAIGCVVSALNQGAAVMLQGRLAQRWVAVGVAIGLAVGLGATLWFSSLGGAVGAAWGFTVSQLVILALLHMRLRRLRREARAHR
jgi:O-antigen/teichoic acid export membrane protein